MSKKLFPVLALMIFIISMIAGCAPAATPTAAPTSVAPAAAEPTAATAPGNRHNGSACNRDRGQPPAATATIKPTVRAATPDRLILATTTSTQDSGLLEYLLPDFEKEFNTKVDVIAVGTGQALAAGQRRQRRCAAGACPRAGRCLYESG